MNKIIITFLISALIGKSNVCIAQIDTVTFNLQATHLFPSFPVKSSYTSLFDKRPGMNYLYSANMESGLGIYDTMQYIKPNVATCCVGIAASMAAVLLCAGEKNKRSALTHSRVMIHQPMGGAQGQVSEIEITYKEITKLKKELYEIIADHSGQPYEKVEKDSDRDYWMTSTEAKEYGMIDEVLSRK